MRPCTLDDLLDLEQLSDPTSVPTARAAVVVSRRDAERNRDAPHLDLVDLAGGERTRLTRGTADRAPRCSPDGRWLAFLRADDGAAQVWLLPVGGGEPYALTETSTRCRTCPPSPLGRAARSGGSGPTSAGHRPWRSSRPPGALRQTGLGLAAFQAGGFSTVQAVRAVRAVSLAVLGLALNQVLGLKAAHRDGGQA